MEARIRSQASPREIRGWNSGSVTSSSPSTSVFPCQCHSINSAHSYSTTCCCYHKNKRAKPGNLPKKKKKTCSFGNRGALYKTELAPFYCWRGCWSSELHLQEPENQGVMPSHLSAWQSVHRKHTASTMGVRVMSTAARYANVNSTSPPAISSAPSLTVAHTPTQTLHWIPCQLILSVENLFINKEALWLVWAKNVHSVPYANSYIYI